MSLMIGVIVVFVRKLMEIYKAESQESFIDVITKISILTFMSIFVTLVDLIAVAVRFFIANTFTVSLSTHIMMYDAFTNCLCMALSYRMFNNWYVKLCGFVDGKCKSCLVTPSKMARDILEMKNVCTDTNTNIPSDL